MLGYTVCVVLLLLMGGVALYAFLEMKSLRERVARADASVEETNAKAVAEIEATKAKSRSDLSLVTEEAKATIRQVKRKAAEEVAAAKAELAQVEPYRHIPRIFEDARIVQEEASARLAEASRQATLTTKAATQQAREILDRANSRAESLLTRARQVMDEARSEAEAYAKSAQLKTEEEQADARRKARESSKKAEESLNAASVYALEIRKRAEERAEEIAGEAYEALKRSKFYESTAQAMRNAVEGYGDTYLVPSAHVLDDLAEEYGFHRSGEMLKLARNRTRIMQKNGTAASCNYPDGWKKDYAINFVLGAFNGKVDAILARVKAAQHGRISQEIRDVFSLVNHNGEVFRQARIHEEYLDARLEELKWAVTVQRLRDNAREEQRAIREQMKEEEKARKEYERALKQAQREEEILNRALEKARREFEAASAEEKSKFEAQLQGVEQRLQEAQEKNRREISMAQLTKKGRVYVISNIGSFGEGVYKIGMTRRIKPLDRVRELGDASVPFPFDVHAMIESDDAPALENRFHKRFLDRQVNKVNRRKEFFRVGIEEIREAAEDLGLDVKWTIQAEAAQYRESLSLDRHIQEDSEFRDQWLARQTFLEFNDPIDDEADEEVDADGDDASGAEADRAVALM